MIKYVIAVEVFNKNVGNIYNIYVFYNYTFNIWPMIGLPLCMVCPDIGQNFTATFSFYWISVPILAGKYSGGRGEFCSNEVTTATIYLCTKK